MDGHNPHPPADPSTSGRIRASDQDRDSAVERLRDAAVEGRIDHDELDERLERALTARTRGELAALTADLPALPPAQHPAPPLVITGGIGGATRGPNPWNVPSHVIARSGIGGVKLDFSRVRTRLPEILVEAYGETSGVTIVIPDGWAADTTDIAPGIGGVKDKTTPDRLPGTPLIRLTGSGDMGGVTIRHPNRWERRRLNANPT